MAHRGCTNIVIYPLTWDGGSGGISISFLNEAAERLEQVRLAEYSEWDIEQISLIARKLIAQQLVLWKPPKR